MYKFNAVKLKFNKGSLLATTAACIQLYKDAFFDVRLVKSRCVSKVFFNVNLKHHTKTHRIRLFPIVSAKSCMQRILLF